MAFELVFLQWIQDNVVCHWLTTIMQMFTNLGNSAIIWIVAIAALLIFKKTRKYGFMAALALLINLLICNAILKPLIDRPRPFTKVAIDLLVAQPGPHSFPSGHTSSAFAVATVIFFWSKPWGVPALFIGALTAFSRMYFFLHYPTDILGGLIVGIGSAFIAKALVEYYSKNKLGSTSGNA
ncbi:MAG: phosphatase PAP2 family protein [Clostridiales bacterium]